MLFRSSRREVRIRLQRQSQLLQTSFGLPDVLEHPRDVEPGFRFAHALGHDVVALVKSPDPRQCQSIRLLKLFVVGIRQGKVEMRQEQFRGIGRLCGILKRLVVVLDAFVVGALFKKIKL